MSCTTGPFSSAPGRRQKRMGPAPFASFEDLSDEVRSRPDGVDENAAASRVVRLPGIREDAISAAAAALPAEAPGSKMSLQAPSAPIRIDISRASSSSQHDDESGESTPERELFGSGEGRTGTAFSSSAAAAASSRSAVELGFGEDGASDLRSSTEELDFRDASEAARNRRPQSPAAARDDSSTAACRRKDSQSSEMGLLSVSGRTSRLSSIGSQGSTHSRASEASRLSVTSTQSGRSPSPHKMLLETSFCGNKSPVRKAGIPASAAAALSSVDRVNVRSVESDVLEKVLLSRKHDPRQVVLAEGISVSIRTPPPPPPERKTLGSIVTKTNDVPPAIVVAPDSTTGDTSKPPGRYVSPSGIEYIYIPLKGPIPQDLRAKTAPCLVSATRIDAKKTTTRASPSSRSLQSRSAPDAGRGEPKYIRIKLKPDHMYGDDDDGTAVAATTSISVAQNVCVELTPLPPPPTARATPAILDVDAMAVISKEIVASKSPSPALSRRSSFASLFKSRETVISPDSPTDPVSGIKRKNTFSGIFRDPSGTRERTRSRSRSGDRVERDASSEGFECKAVRTKSVLSLFKHKKSSQKSNKSSGASSPEASCASAETLRLRFDASERNDRFENPLRGESVRIPLHSPTYYEERSLLQELKSSSQESQETVIEAAQLKREHDPVRSDSRNVEMTCQDVVTRHNIDVAVRPTSISSKIWTEENEAKKTTTMTASSSTITVTTTTTTIAVASTASSTLATVVATLSVNGVPRQLYDEANVVIAEMPKSKVEHSRSASKERDVVPETGEHTIVVQGAASPPRTDGGHSSAESENNYDERDEHAVGATAPTTTLAKPETVETERQGLVRRTDSYEDELPYVPTTLPQERSVAVPMIPIKQRGAFEMKTCPIDRPRSTTPINLSNLDDYRDDTLASVESERSGRVVEKLKISLPRDESCGGSAGGSCGVGGGGGGVVCAGRLRSPRRPSSSSADQVPHRRRSNSRDEAEATLSSQPPPPPPPPPPLPPKKAVVIAHKEWINFEEIPERRKPPRRIQTVPSSTSRTGEVGTAECGARQHNVVYNYVNPEDCKCECHEVARERQHRRRSERPPSPSRAESGDEDQVPLLEDDTGEDEKSAHEPSAIRKSPVSDSSVDLSAGAAGTVPGGDVERHETITNVDFSLRTPFTCDLGLSSNRSSIVSQEETQSPDRLATTTLPPPSSNALSRIM